MLTKKKVSKRHEKRMRTSDFFLAYTANHKQKKTFAVVDLWHVFGL